MLPLFIAVASKSLRKRIFSSIGASSRQSLRSAASVKSLRCFSTLSKGPVVLPNHEYGQFLEQGNAMDAKRTTAARQHLQEAVFRGRQKGDVQIRPATTRLLVTNVSANLVVEDLEYRTEDGPQGWVPLRLIHEPAGSHKPVVIFLHGTGSNKDAMLPLMQEYAMAGYISAAIDCRYHGERAPTVLGCSPRDVYEDALIRAWREGGERPFLLDNVWDLVHLLDYLFTRSDVDKARIGMTGVSLGGMHTWLCAALDHRIALSAPVIGVQNFGWALHHNLYQGRVDSIPRFFAAAAEDMAKPGVDAEVVGKVWQRLLPGLLEHYDAPMSLACISPRPLLIVNGEVDPRCPMLGVYEAMEAAKQAYIAAGVRDRLCLYVEPGCGHEVTETMMDMVRRWFDLHLQVQPQPGGWWCSVM